MNIIEQVKARYREQRMRETNPEYRKAVLKYKQMAQQENMQKEKEMTEIKEIDRQNSFIGKATDNIKKFKKQSATKVKKFKKSRASGGTIGGGAFGSGGTKSAFEPSGKRIF